MVIGVTNGTHSEAQLRRYLHTHLVESASEVPGLVEAARARHLLVTSGAQLSG